MHHQKAEEGPAHQGMGGKHSRTHNADAKSQGKGAGGGGRGKYSFMGQVIPIYGFGILLYIVYIIFKIISKGNHKKSDSEFLALKSEDCKIKTSDGALAQLQERLEEMEEMMESIVSRVNCDPDRISSLTSEYEEKLLRQLRGFTLVMQAGVATEGMSPEREAEEVPYCEGWGEHTEESFPLHEEPSSGQRFNVTFPDGLNTPQHLPTAEELAERMEDEWKDLRTEEGPCLQRDPTEDTEGERMEKRPERGLKVSFNDQKDVLCYLEDGAESDTNDEEEEEEDDPIMKAESLIFDCKVYTDLGDKKEQKQKEEQEEYEEQEYLEDLEEQEEYEEQEYLEDLEEQEEYEEQEYLEDLEEQEKCEEQEYLEDLEEQEVCEEQEYLEDLEEQEEYEEQEYLEDLEEQEEYEEQQYLEDLEEQEELEEEEDSDEQEEEKDSLEQEDSENERSEDTGKLFHEVHGMESNSFTRMDNANKLGFGVLRKRGTRQCDK